MILFKRRRIGALFLIIMSALLMASCGSGNEQSDVMREITENLSSMKADSAKDQGALYEITQLTSPENNAVLCCAGLYDESRLLLITANPDSQGVVSSYTAQLLDLLRGEKEELTSFDRAQVKERRLDGTEGLSVISCDPLVIFDSRGGVIYLPDTPAGRVILPSFLSDAVPCCLNGRLWLSSARGIVYEVTEDGELRVSWTLPCEFGAFTPVICGHEGRLSFATYSRRDPSLQVYVDVDPESGESEYYLSDIPLCDRSRQFLERDRFFPGFQHFSPLSLRRLVPVGFVRRRREARARLSLGYLFLPRCQVGGALEFRVQCARNL